MDSICDNCAIIDLDTDDDDMSIDCVKCIFVSTYNFNNIIIHKYIIMSTGELLNEKRRKCSLKGVS